MNMMISWISDRGDHSPQRISRRAAAKGSTDLEIFLAHGTVRNLVREAMMMERRIIAWLLRRN
ncbi:hypothetical protein, partial [Mesorhizobium sp. B2-5-9]|uniref:hypothetical protein n=1 Tax=Mesorhizobium sp. B2-5-9 TaxID=2589921 RepID=UPI001AEE72A6